MAEPSIQRVSQAYPKARADKPTSPLECSRRGGVQRLAAKVESNAREPAFFRESTGAQNE